MSRWRASAIHLVISAAVVAVVLLAMLLLWYPPPYFVLMGGTTLVILIAGCDVVLGPLITSIIFKAGKKGLVFDLGVIAFIQACALTYGLYTMYQARPVFVVFAIDRFEIAAANQIAPAELISARPEYSSMPLTGPRVVAAMLPTDPRERLGIAMRSMAGLSDIKTMSHLYVPYQWLAADAAKKARPLADLYSKDPTVRGKLLAEFRDDVHAFDRSGYVPIVGRSRSMAAIVDRRSGNIETIVNIDPW
jgi:hypothetical protein